MDMRISIEGNLGCGKSSLLAELGHRWNVFPEPVQEWETILRLFYTNPQRWALAMNAQALLSFTRVKDTEGTVSIVERSPLSCKEVFARLNKNEGAMSDKEWLLFCDLYTNCSWTPDVIIYLLSPTGVCMERMQRRGRASEANVSQDYLSKLQFAHSTMLRWYDGEVHVVDATQEPATVLARVNDILQAYG